VLGVDANRVLEILAGFFNGIADSSSSKALIHRIDKQSRNLASRCIVPSSGSFRHRDGARSGLNVESFDVLFNMWVLRFFCCLPYLLQK
jgi:hypothetical protein